ncbi:MAG: NAD(P)-dependent oxidoreductase [Planctomycetales bacterium]
MSRTQAGDVSRRVGLIGLGLLGSALAERLLAAGFDVIGFDLDPPRRESFARRGGQAAESVVEVADQSTRIFLSLPNSDVVAAVVDELLPALPAGALLIDTTTGQPEAAAARGRELASRGIGYLDATVAGSSEQTRRGEVLVMVGAEPEHLEACRDLLATFSRKTLHLGPPGAGSRMKLVVNLALGLHRAVLAEALSLAQALGFEAGQALETLRASPACSAAMETKGEKMIAGDFTPQARLAQHLKDVELILQASRDGGSWTPFSELHRDVLQSLVDQGHGDLDNSAILKAFESRGGRGPNPSER